MSRQTDELRLRDRGNPSGVLALSVAALVIGLALTASQFAGAGQQADAPPEKTVYQDFRNKRPLLPVFTLLGPDKEGEIKAEDEGLRITLSATRPQNWPTEVTTTFPLSGDFEITGTYEFLAGERPAKGYGVGVHLNIADTENRIKFAKICRAIMPGQGSVHLAQYWHTKKDHQMHSKPTEAKAGQLRLVRVDGALRFLVSDGPGEKFREIWFQGDFGNDDMEHFRFGVSDSGQPGNAVDARLIDLKIRMGGTIPDKAAFDPAPLVAPAPLGGPDAEPDGAAPPSWIDSGLARLLGLAILVALALGLGVWGYRRRRAIAQGTPPLDVFPCSGCGKKLKVKAGLAGKSVKCPHCGKTMTVPPAPADEAGGAGAEGRTVP